MKPHLYRCHGWWICETNAATGLGRTPEQAYGYWISNRRLVESIPGLSLPATWGAASV